MCELNPLIYIKCKKCLKFSLINLIDPSHFDHVTCSCGGSLKESHEELIKDLNEFKQIYNDLHQYFEKKEKTHKKAMHKIFKIWRLWDLYIKTLTRE
jgi:hypothetical protein